MKLEHDSITNEQITKNTRFDVDLALRKDVIPVAHWTRQQFFAKTRLTVLNLTQIAVHILLVLVDTAESSMKKFRRNNSTLSELGTQNPRTAH